jgi:hypothetical protein
MLFRCRSILAHKSDRLRWLCSKQPGIVGQHKSGLLMRVDGRSHPGCFALVSASSLDTLKAKRAVCGSVLNGFNKDHPRGKEQVMLPSGPRLSIRLRLGALAILWCALLACTPVALAQSAHVRVSLAGYKAGETPFRAYRSGAVEPLPSGRCI